MSLKGFGREVLRANFGSAIKQLIDPRNYQGAGYYPTTPISLTGHGKSALEEWFSFSGTGSCLRAYDKCPPLQAIVNRRATAFVNFELKILNSLGKDSVNSSAKTFKKLIENPNKFQNRSQFMGQVHTYIDLVGYAVILPVKPNGFPNIEAESLWVVPPDLVTLQKSYHPINFVNGGIQAVTICGINFSIEDVIIISDINPSVTDMVIPGSKIKSLSAPINNIIGAYESESTLIKYRGPTGLITPQVSTAIGSKIPIGAKEKLELEQKVKIGYGMMSDQTQIIIADAAVNYQKTGFSAAELGLNDTIVNGTKAIADTIGYPTELLSIVNPTFNNKEAAEKEVYTKHIIPGAANVAQQFASYFLTSTDKLVLCYDHVPEMQPDKLKKYQASKFQTEDLILQFKMDLISVAQFKIAKELVPLPGDDVLYYSNIRDLIDPKNINMLTDGIQQQQQPAQQ
jgi:hypothetical protein